jgi:uncharacterized protein YpiB (UPF0302 family)
MDMQQFALFIKLVTEEYRLKEEEISRLSERLMADDQEFKSVWKSFQDKAKRPRKGVDYFKPILKELLT